MNRIKLLGLDIYGCREALERLDDYVDHELSPEEDKKVRQHLVICRHCLHKFKFQEELLLGVRAKAQTIPLNTDVDVFKDRINALFQPEEEWTSETNPPI